MIEAGSFPSWVLESIEEHQSQLNPKSLGSFKQLVGLFPDFENAFLRIPSTSEIGVLTSFDPSEIKAFWGVKSPLEFIVMNMTELTHFNFVYQMRELGLSLLAALREGRFYVAAIISRAILEVVCVNYYWFRRVDAQVKGSMTFLKNAAKTKSTQERSILFRKYYHGLFEAFSCSFTANAASSMDRNNKTFQSWQNYMSEVFDIEIPPGENVKKINTLTAIEDIQNSSKLPLMQAYDILSEFVHPNLGSRMLIINTKKPSHPIMDALEIGDNKKNTEAALFYFDHLSDGSFYSWTLALSLFQREQGLISMLDKICSGDGSWTVH